jgi:hypothetical protein
MWTIKYKNAFIHGYCDKAVFRWSTEDGEVSNNFKSLHAAKISITKRKVINMPAHS